MVPSIKTYYTNTLFYDCTTIFCKNKYPFARILINWRIFFAKWNKNGCCTEQCFSLLMLSKMKTFHVHLFGFAIKTTF